MAPNTDKKNFMALPQGYRLEDYTIDGLLGTGGFAMTYAAWDQTNDRAVVLKEYFPSDFASRIPGESEVHAKRDAENEFKWGLARFEEEAWTLVRFSHPNIMPILRFTEANETAYIVMPLENGQNLDEMLATKAEMLEPELMDFLVPLLDGLANVHKNGILHRDIKPSNIVVRDDGVPLLIDFGSARMALAGHTGTLTRIVTPGFSPIEQYSSTREQGPWTDIYSLGATLYRIVSGIQPPDAPMREREDSIARASRIGKKRYSQGLLRAIDWALNPSPEARPQSVEEFRRTIVVTGGNPQTLRAKRKAPTTPKERFWKITALLLGSALFAILVLIALEMFIWRGS